MAITNIRHKKPIIDMDHPGGSTIVEPENIPGSRSQSLKIYRKPTVKPLVGTGKTASRNRTSVDSTLFNQLPIGIVLISLNSGKIIASNAEFERQSGRTLNQLKEMRIWELIHPRYSRTFMRRFWKQRQNCGYHSIEQEILRPDGSILFGKFDGCTVKIGKQKFVQTTVYDITERKKMEDTLKESEKFNSSLLDSSPYPIVVNSPDTSIIYVNRAFEEATGFSSEEMLGLQAPYPWWSETTRCKSKFDLVRILRRAKRGAQDVFLNKNGQKIIAEINTEPIKINGKFRGCLTSWVDVTASRQSEKALRESEQYNASLLNNSPNPVLVMNPDSSIQYANPALQELTGFSFEELIGRKVPYPWSIDPDDGKNVLRMRRGKRKIERRIKKKNGEPCWIQITSTSVSEGRKIKYYISNWVDITERKKSEEHLLELNKELRSLSAHLENISENERARIAREIHDELGQSLAVLKMDVCWISNNLAPDQNTLRDLADSMAKSIDIIVQKIKRLCIELRPKLLDDIGIGGTIEWLAREFEKTTGIICQVTCDDLNEKTLSGEKATAIFRIFQEALTNIYRHSQATQVLISLTREDNYAMLKVNDNGIGIKQDQISSPRSFGLIGMRERVRHFGGDLEISGTSSTGTQLIVRLPLSREAK